MDRSDEYLNIWRAEPDKVGSVNPGLPAKGMKEPREIPITLAHVEREGGRDSVVVNTLQ